MTSSSLWYYLEGEEARGPVEADHLRQMLASGRLPAATLVAQSGWQQWLPAQQALPAPVTKPPATPVASGPPPSPPAGVSAPAFVMPTPTARPQPQPLPQPGPQPVPAKIAATAVQIRCVQGPDTGKAFWIGPAEVSLGRAAGIGLADPSLAEHHVRLSWQSGSLRLQTFPGQQILVLGQPLAEAALALGARFQLGASTWQVGHTPAGISDLLQSLGEKLNRLASVDKLEGFSLREMFSEVFKHRTPEEIEDYFLVGTSRTTPRIEDVETGWPKPWFFLRVLLFIAVVFLAFTVATQHFGNPKLIPGLIMMGALAVPLATVILFFELDTPRNVSFHKVLMLVCLGGVASLAVSLFGFDIAHLNWLGASSAGIVEEIGKLLAVMLIARQAKHKYILNGMLFGAAVGAGFAAFESAGYAFDALRDNQFVEVEGDSVNVLLTDVGVSAMLGSILLRAFLTPFGHVAWTAIAAGALWRVKGARVPSPTMFFDAAFLRTFCIPVALHMIWNAPIPSPLYVKHLLLGVIGWFVVFGLVQQGLRQVRAEQRDAAAEELSRTRETTTGMRIVLTGDPARPAVLAPDADKTRVLGPG